MANIAFIGTGEIAKMHARAISALSEKWNIIGAYDLNVTANKEFCDAWGGIMFSSIEELLADDRVNVVYICTRHDSHTSLAMDACRAKKAVFLEKPVAMTFAQAQQLLNFYNDNQVPFAVGYNMRVAPATIRFCALLKQYKVQPLSFKASMVGPAFMQGWASDAIQGGGVLTCQGSHMMDFIATVLQSPIDAVCARTQYLEHDKSREPNAATLLIRLKNGIWGTLLLHDCGNAAFHTENEGRMVGLTVYAPQGTFEVDVYGKIRYGTVQGFTEETPCENRSPYVSWGYLQQAVEFTKVLNGQKSLLCNLEQGVQVAAVVEATKKSAQEMRQINL